METIYDRLSLSEAMQVKGILKSLVSQIKKWRYPIRELKKLQADIDSIVHEKIEKQSSCRKGCSYCCYINVDVSHLEAEILKPFVRDQDMPQLEKQKNLDFQDFLKLPYEDKKCIFLENNQCRVYNDRPLACRKYHVISDPELCNTKNGISTTLVAANLLLEIRVNAFHLVFKNNHNLATQLLKK